MTSQARSIKAKGADRAKSVDAMPGKLLARIASSMTEKQRY